MPDGIPPLLESNDGDGAAELERIARFIYSNRSGIALPDLDNWFDVNPSELDELDSIIDSLTRPSSSPLTGGIRIFEVTASPEGEIVVRGQRLAIVRDYTLNFIPNRKRRTIAPWASFGQR